VDVKKKETNGKDVPAGPSNPDKKLWISIGLEAIETHAHHFSPGKSRCLRMTDIKYVRDAQGGD
jgi:hypothetical protein